MAFTTVVDKTVGDTFTEAMWDTYIKDNMNKGVVRPIAETTLSVAAASIDFTSIAADWSHLLLVAVLRGTNASAGITANLRFNGDAGANYDRQHLFSNNTTIAASEQVAVAQIDLGGGQIPAATAPADVFGLVLVEIAHYASAKNKVCLARVAGKVGSGTGSFYTFELAGFWRSNAVITSVALLPSAGNFDIGCRATLYGMGGI